MRLPIRVRLTAWYAVLVALIIGALGAFVVLQLRSDLTATIDRDVRSAAAQLGAGYAMEGTEEFLDLSESVLPGSGAAAQVLDRDGRILLRFGEPIADGEIAPEPVRRAAVAGRSRLITVARDGNRYKAMVVPTVRQGRPQVVVVAETLRDVDRSVGRLVVLLLIAGPAVLALTALSGWWLSRKALRPVERMASQAGEISIDPLHDRLAVPAPADEIRHLGLTLNAMLERLEHGVQEKRRLIADASHELRTPLAVMRSELDVSLREEDLPEDARAALESTREEVDAMSRTVDNLLTLAQVDEGRLELLTTPVGIDEAIEAAVRPLRPLAEAKGVRLEVETVRCDALADPQRLHLALTNLIENAIKYATPGGVVQVAGWCEADELGVTVRDDGPGIPVAARAHVFDRFYRVDDARGRGGAGGSGLGLSICREIAGAHGGRVWVDSQEGVGSAFSLGLPRAPGSRR
jgi:heavy metal sensor kinase